MRAAVIGAGMICSDHVLALRKCGIHIATICDTVLERAERIARNFNVARTDADWREVLSRDHIDIISICTPPASHSHIAIAALVDHKNVICEKPVAHSLVEADRIIDAASRSNGKLLVVHQLRLQPMYMRLKYLIDEGHLGQPCFARVARLDAPPSHLVRSGNWGKWINGGGVLMTKAVHELDLLLGLFGPAKRVQAMMGTFNFPIESEDHVSASIEFANGVLASVCVGSPCGGLQHRTFEIHGDAGSAGQSGCRFWLHCNRGEELQQYLEKRFPDFQNPITPIGSSTESFGQDGETTQCTENTHTPIFEHFIKSIRNGAPPLVSAVEGRSAIELCVAIYSSAIQGGNVDIPIDFNSRFYNGISRNDYSMRG